MSKTGNRQDEEMMNSDVYAIRILVRSKVQCEVTGCIYRCPMQTSIFFVDTLRDLAGCQFPRRDASRSEDGGMDRGERAFASLGYATGETCARITRVICSESHDSSTKRSQIVAEVRAWNLGPSGG